MFLTITQFIGRFHPALVHLPIGILLIGALLQLLQRRENQAISMSVVKIVFLSGCISAWVTCLTGYLLSLSGDYDEGLVDLHMWLSLTVAVISTFICWKIVRRENDLLYKISSVALPVVIMITGHLGGSLTHGTDYLISGLGPDSVSYPPHPPITNVQEAKVYGDIIQPILEKECYSCHSSRKQKGNLRLDDSLHIMKGGKNGVSVVAGNPSGSELIKRLLLPKEDEHHMPKEHPSLREDQIHIISWWIAQGADFNKKVKALPQPDTIAVALLKLQSRGSQYDSLVPAAPVAAASSGDIKKLKEKGVSVMPVSQNNNYLVADFVNATSVSDKDLALLVPLQKQLIGLKLGNTKVGDAAMEYVARCGSLTTLQLNNTNVGDKGIAALHTLTGLQSLNLVGTNVTARGIESLDSLKKLRRIYLYKTRVDNREWKTLKEHFPHALLDSGGYQVPFLADDTTILKAPRTEKE